MRGETTSFLPSSPPLPPPAPLQDKKLVGLFLSSKSLASSDEGFSPPHLPTLVLYKKSNICLKNVKRNRLGRNSAAFCYFLQLRWVFYANRTRAACLFCLTATKCEQLGRYSRQFCFLVWPYPFFRFTFLLSFFCTRKLILQGCIWVFTIQLDSAFSLEHNFA